MDVSFFQEILARIPERGRQILDLPSHRRRSSPARHRQVEPYRAPHVLVRQHELARQAAHQPPSHRPADRFNKNRSTYFGQCPKHM